MQCTFAKLLSHNDASQEIHQGGPLIPKALSRFFPELDRSRSISEEYIKVELQDGYTSLGTVQARYVWYKSKRECHLTNIGPIIPLWTENDAMKFEVIDAGYRLQLIRQGSEFWEEIADQMGPRYLGRCGLLSGDACDFENFRSATCGKKRLQNQKFDADKFAKEAEDRFKRRKRKPNISIPDPDKTHTRSLQHDRCVARLSKYLERWMSLTSGKHVGIDLKAEREDIVAIFEVKTLRGDEMRQFRAATGQLCHYSFLTSKELESADKTIHRIICTDRRPSEEWQDYATYWDIGVIWLPEKSSSKKKSKLKKEAEKPGSTSVARRMIRELTKNMVAC